jgi:hypothetical protein
MLMLMKSIPEEQCNYDYYCADRGASDRGASEDGGEIPASPCCCGIINVREVLAPPVVNSVVFIIEKLPSSSSCPNAGACERIKLPDVGIIIIVSIVSIPNNAVIADIVRVNWVFFILSLLFTEEL